jgi:hypothetical protein
LFSRARKFPTSGGVLLDQLRYAALDTYYCLVLGSSVVGPHLRAAGLVAVLRAASVIVLFSGKKGVFEGRVNVQPGVLCLGGRLVGGSISARAVSDFHVSGRLRPFGFAGAWVVPQWTLLVWTWLVSDAVVA